MSNRPAQSKTTRPKGSESPDKIEKPFQPESGNRLTKKRNNDAPKSAGIREITLPLGTVIAAVLAIIAISLTLLSAFHNSQTNNLQAEIRLLTGQLANSQTQIAHLKQAAEKANEGYIQLAVKYENLRRECGLGPDPSVPPVSGPSKVPTTQPKSPAQDR